MKFRINVFLTLSFFLLASSLSQAQAPDFIYTVAGNGASAAVVTSTPLTYSSSSTVSNVACDAATSASIGSGGSALSVDEESILSGGPAGSSGVQHWCGVNQSVTVYSKYPATAAISVSYSGSISFSGTPGMYGTDSSVGPLPFGSSYISLAVPSTSGSGTNSGGGSATTNVELNCGGTTASFSEYPGQVYYRLTNWDLGTINANQTGFNGYLDATGTMDFSVSIGATTPHAEVTGPYVSNVLNNKPSLGSVIYLNNISYDPDNAGSTVLRGICSASWLITKPDGTTSTQTYLDQIHFTADLPGPYEVLLTITDNEGNSSQTTKTVNVGAFRGPGDLGPTLSCGTGGSAGAGNGGGSFPETLLSIGSGDMLISFPDPVQARDNILSGRVHIRTQTLFPTRNIGFGNGTFSYGIEVNHASDIDGVDNWVVIDGNGRESFFGPTASAPSAAPGVYSSLSVTGTGYTLSGAGEPENIRSAGNYSYDFDSGGKLLTITDPNGNTQDLTYTSGKVTSVTDNASQKSLTITYTSGLATSISENGTDAVTHITYTSGKITHVSLSNSTTTSREADIEYDSALGLPNKIITEGDTTKPINISYSPIGYGMYAANTTYYNGASNLNYFTQPASGKKFRTVQTNAKGGVIKYDFNDSLDLEKMETPPPPSQTTPLTYVFTYDSSRNLTQLKNRTGSGGTTMTATYNSLGLPLTVKINNVLQRGYTWSGADVLTVSDNLTTLSTYTYGDTSHPHTPTAMTDAEGNTWSYTLNAYGQVTAVAPPSGSPTGTKTYTYDENSAHDSFGWLTKISQGGDDIVSFSNFTSQGLPQTVTTKPNSSVTNATQYTYDSNRRLKTVTHPDSAVVTNTYVGKDLNSTTDEAGTVTSFAFCPSCGRMTNIFGPNSRDYSWTLNGDFDVTNFEDSRGKNTTYLYGTGGQLKRRTYPDGTQVNYEYDENGRLHYKVDGRSWDIGINYDDFGRLSSIAPYASGAHGRGFNYSSDNTLSSIDWDNTTTYTYYPDKMPKSVENDLSYASIYDTQKVTATYNPDNTLATLTWKTNGSTTATWSYYYDARGRMTSVVNSFGETTSYTYDNENKLLTQTNQNGTGTDYTYNEARGWRTNITHKLSGTAFASYDLEYDSGNNTVGNLTKVTELDSSEVAYGYNANYRLTSEARTGTGSYTKSYVYDTEGNITSMDSSTFASYDDGSKISSLSGGSVSYDGEGNTTAVTTSGGPAGTFAYNDYDNLTRQTHNSVNYYYGYQPDTNLRVIRYTGGVRNQYVYWQGKLIGEYDENGTKRAYTWGSDGIVSLRHMNSSASRWYHYGPQGETRQLTDGSGSVTDSYRYTAYGVPTSVSGSTYNPHRYVGKYGCYTEGDVSMVLCGQRWYHPYVMRWMTRDPIGYEGGFNIYGYVDGNPSNFFDPDGRDQVVNNTGGPMVVEGNLGAGHGSGKQVFGVIGSDGKIYGGDRERIKGYKNSQDALDAYYNRRDIRALGNIQDVDYYVCDHEEYKLYGDSEGPITSISFDDDGNPKENRQGILDSIYRYLGR
jgi:RHS repeat-associated protein